MVRFLILSIFLSTAGFAQTDSVVVTGRILHLTPRLYRQSPQVAISRNNMLQADRELIRPAPLAADGSFRVAVPLIYPYEEFYFNFNNITTAFLASAGTISIELDADSLFTAAVPFRFKGSNAAVNQQYARYKAFEATFPEKVNSKQLSRQAGSKSDAELHSLLMDTYTAPLRGFSLREKPLPLLSTWLMNIARYNAATFQYDKAMAEAGKVDAALDDSLRPANDRILTAARATAANRFAEYSVQRASAATTGNLPVAKLATILMNYTPRLAEVDRAKLEEVKERKSARTADVRFFEQLMRRRPDTLGRLINYETLIHRTSGLFDSSAVEYITAYWLAKSLPGLTLNFSELLYQYTRPRIKQPLLLASLNELYQLQIKDSDRIRQSVAALPKTGRVTLMEVSPGVFVTRDVNASGEALLNQLVRGNRGKTTYLLLWSSGDDAGRQAAIDAQRLRDIFNSRDFTLLYVSVSDDSSKDFIPEFIVRNQLKGDHLIISEEQVISIISYLQAINSTEATLIGPTGKIIKRGAPLPNQPDEIQKLMQKGK